MARTNIYPPSIKPGVPTLGKKPDGWIATTFGQVLKPIYRKATLIDNQEYQLVIAKRNRGGVVPRSILKGSEIKTKTQFYIRKNDFLIARRQIIHGGCGIVPSDLDGAVVSNEYSTLLVKDGLLLDYLKYYCHTIYFQQTCFQSSVGVDVEKMIFKLDYWFKLPVYLPPVPEQCKIAEILSTWDEAIAKTQCLIASLCERKKWLMESLLTGQVRFAGLTGKWQETQLDKVADVIMGQSPSSSAYNDDGIGLPLIQGNANITHRKTSPKVYTSEITKVCEIDDIILSVRAPVGETALSIHKACIGRGVCAIRAKNCNSKFLYHLLVYNEQRWQSYAQGSTFTAINSTDIRQFVLLIPATIKEQEILAKLFDSCDEEISLHSQRLTALQQQKKGLMQRLLTGEIRVRVAG